LAAGCFQISANDSVRRSPRAMNPQHSGRRRSDSGTPWLTLSEQKMHGKIKRRGTVAASSRCLHKVFSGTPFFPNGTLGRQLSSRRELLRAIYYRARQSTIESLRHGASVFAPRDCKGLAIGCHDHAQENHAEHARPPQCICHRLIYRSQSIPRQILQQIRDAFHPTETIVQLFPSKPAAD